MLGKRGGRLIEDHHLGVESQRPGNRHHVTLGDAEGFQRGSRVDLDFQPGEDLVALRCIAGQSSVFSSPLYRYWPTKMFSLTESSSNSTVSW